jgi:hypothetical protein
MGGRPCAGVRGVVELAGPEVNVAGLARAAADPPTHAGFAILGTCSSRPRGERGERQPPGGAASATQAKSQEARRLHSSRQRHASTPCFGESRLASGSAPAGRRGPRPRGPCSSAGAGGRSGAPASSRPQGRPAARAPSGGSASLPVQGAWPLPPGSLAERVRAATNRMGPGLLGRGLRGARPASPRTVAHLHIHLWRTTRTSHLAASDAEPPASTSRGLLEMHGHEQTASCCKCRGDAKSARACTGPAALCSGRTQSPPLARQGQRASQTQESRRWPRVTGR